MSSVLLKRPNVQCQSGAGLPECEGRDPNTLCPCLGKPGLTGGAQGRSVGEQVSVRARSIRHPHSDPKHNSHRPAPHSTKLSSSEPGGVCGQGAVTVFLATANQAVACYPSNKCIILGSYPGITGTGLFCALNCQSSVYITQSNKLYQLSTVQGAVTSGVVATDTSIIFCLAGGTQVKTALNLVLQGCVRLI